MKEQNLQDFMFFWENAKDYGYSSIKASDFNDAMRISRAFCKRTNRKLVGVCLSYLLGFFNHD